ncbi:Uma2 family endonuclease [Actinomadura sp. WMMB 499]|uniref:Uma2 family endonuclease n=1 Tax=Actinomadura sp. WMMB 499 TaxID=1219491 RepID=UPI001C3F94CE|nr:Uma2 family endonuclease [Actinomadura sp. WMMB 499]
MRALPEDHWLLGVRPQPVTAEEYEALPEDICRMIEVVGGQVIFSEAPTPRHRRAGRRLAQLIEKHARRAMERGHGCLEVDTDIDLRLQDVPLLNRRPDVVLYRCIDHDNRERLRAEHVALVVEIVSPGSEVADSMDKLSEYGKASIAHYWIVRLDGQGISIIERYRLDTATRCYKHTGTLMRDEDGGPPEVDSPIPVTIDWSELEY